MRHEVWMISYDEECTDQHYQRLKELVPEAQIINGVEGIKQAYCKAAERCESEHLFLVDADNLVLDVFNLEFINSVPPGDSKVFFARNDFGIAYGHGGIKFVSRERILKATSEDTQYGFLDFTEVILGGTYPYDPSVLSEHRLGHGFRRWRSIFREVLKCGLRTPDLLKLWLEHEEPRRIFAEDVVDFLRVRTPQQIFDDINSYMVLERTYENRRLLHLQK